MNTLPPHVRQFSGPKLIPFGIIRRVGNARIEPCLRENPVARSAYRLGKFEDVVVRESEAEGIFCVMKKILSVYERDGPLDCWLNSSGALVVSSRKR